MYYLQSRYYDPKIGRFINADSYASTGQGFIGNNMFVYCLNNPINRIDIAGEVSLWYYLIVDHDMGYIHRAVVAHIAQNYNYVNTEVTLSEFGRADIVYNKSVWEVKHAGTDPAHRTAIAMLQAYGYILLNDELETLGATGAFSGTFYIECSSSSYVVKYETPAPGVTLYTVQEASNYNGEYYRVYVPVAERETDANHSFNTGIIGLPFAFGVATVGGSPFGAPNQEFKLI